MIFFFTESKYSFSLMGKLIGGESVEYGKYKFTASFRLDNVHFCNACLLSNKHALTAAVCLKDFLTKPDIPKFDPYTLVAGRLDTEGATIFTIEEVQAHRRYSFQHNDPNYAIGVITVNHQLTFET